MPTALLSLPAEVFHLAEATNWPAIRSEGLLSAAALMARAYPSARARAVAERAWRAGHTVLPGGAQIRDQKPMPPAALARALVGLEPADWYALINARVFFWIDPERLNRQRAACRARPQVVLTVSTERLLARHAERAAVSPINSGNARRRPAKRSAASFVPYAQWRRDGWAAEAAALATTPRPRRHAPVELAVLHAVPDIMEAVLRVTPLPVGRAFVPGK